MELTPMALPKDQFDGPFKEILEGQLSQFVAFFVPEAWNEVDWDRKPESLNTELRRSRRSASAPDRRADNLFKVFLKSGTAQFVVIHIEMQSTVDSRLAGRIFEYAYRAWDRHHQDVSSIVVLGDDSPSFRPSQFGWQRWGSKMSYEFPVIKLNDYRRRWSYLEQSRNIFAVVVMAFLKTRDTRRDPEARLRWKRRLVRLLYQRSYSREEIVALFRLIDWMLHLPEKQAIIFEEDLESIEAEFNMPYISSIERRALQKGIEQGLEQGLEKGLEKGRDQGRLQQLRKQLEYRFGKLPEWTLDRLGKATSSLLDDWAVRLLDASKVEDVFAEPRKS
jgi:hypothetical protein